MPPRAERPWSSGREIAGPFEIDASKAAQIWAAGMPPGARRKNRIFFRVGWARGREGGAVAGIRGEKKVGPRKLLPPRTRCWFGMKGELGSGGISRSTTSSRYQSPVWLACDFAPTRDRVPALRPLRTHSHRRRRTRSPSSRWRHE